MAYLRSQMLYDNGHYVWTAPADHDNPFIRGGNERAELNRKEGYEVLYFINHITWTNNDIPTLNDYRKAEKAIRNDVPHNIHTRHQIYIWLAQNWRQILYP